MTVMDIGNIPAEYDPATDTYHASYEPDMPGTLLEAVIDLVSMAIEKEPEAMDPLFEVIDVDALDRLFRSRESQTGSIEFKYCGCDVSVVNSGEVTVSSPSDGE